MKQIIISILTIFIAVNVNSKEIIIDMLNKREDGEKMVYSQDIAKVDVGDTIKWLPTAKGHNVEFLAGPDGVDLPKKSGLNKEVSITFEKPGVYLYVCTPHKVMGMIGLVVVGGDTSNKDAVAKTKMLGRGKKKMKAFLDQI